jgi:hypothetical protein
MFRMNSSAGLPKDLNSLLKLVIIKQRLQGQYFLNLPMNTRS